jgi:hypothetical protein
VGNFVRTGIWDRYRDAARSEFGPNKGGDQWNRAFGQLFEEWVRVYAAKARTSPKAKAQIILPSFPGAADEIDDAVLVENGVVVMFSAKGRMVRESIARYSVSRRELLDWYDAYLFEIKNDDFRGGAIRQISARIDMLRAGRFENRGITRNARVHPVVVTYDSLGENQMLYAWISERCKHHGVLQQPNVGPPVLAVVQDYEALVAIAADGRSVVALLEKRLDPKWKNERLEVILGTSKAQRLPQSGSDYAVLIQRMGTRIGMNAFRGWSRPRRNTDDGPLRMNDRADELASQRASEVAAFEPVDNLHLSLQHDGVEHEIRQLRVRGGTTGVDQAMTHPSSNIAFVRRAASASQPNRHAQIGVRAIYCACMTVTSPTSIVWPALSGSPLLLTVAGLPRMTSVLLLGGPST